MRADVARKRLREMNRRRGRLSDLLAALERVREFVDEHNETDRAEMLDRLHCYTRIAVDELMHVCKSGDDLNAAAGLAHGMWRHM